MVRQIDSVMPSCQPIRTMMPRTQATTAKIVSTAADATMRLFVATTSTTYASPMAQKMPSTA